MLYVPYRASDRVTRIVGSERQTVQWRRERRRRRLVRLRVFQRVDEGEISGDFFVGRGLEKDATGVGGIRAAFAFCGCRSGRCRRRARAWFRYRGLGEEGCC